jgi:osmotically-inducible protein OsmY
MKTTCLMRQTVSFLVLLSYGALSSGCEPFMVVGTGAAVTTSAAEERGIGGVLSDSSIKTRIQVRYMEQNPTLAQSIDVVVRQGRVLLTGTIKDPRMQIDAVRLAWKVDGVQEVIDETVVGGGGGLGAYANDTWITTQIKSKMIFEKEIQSLNYNIQSLKSTVYIMGIAQSQRELDRVIDIARRTSKVKKVISYVTLKPQSIGMPYAPQKGRVIRPSPQKQSPGKSRMAPVELEDSADFTPLSDMNSSSEAMDMQSLDEPNSDSAFQ